MRINEEAILYNEKTYVPLRAVSESLGANVEWDGNTTSAFVTFTEDDAVAKIVEDVSSSVVTIIGNYNSTNASVQYNNPTAHGSGVVYKSSGYIITNAHVVRDIKNITVVLNNGESYPAKVLYSDELADLAVVKIDKLGLRPITFAESDSVISGKTAIAIGTPISLTMRNSVTKGIVSGVSVELADSHYKLIQTDAAVNPGNSGGPLLNIKGELIGIVSSKYVDTSIDNMSFAIPVDTVDFAISQFEKYGCIIRPKLDFTLEQSWEAKIGLPTKKGLKVKSSTNPAVAVGGEITAVGGISVHSINDFNEAVKDTYDGVSLTLTVTRNGAAADIKVNL